MELDQQAVWEGQEVLGQLGKQEQLPTLEAHPLILNHPRTKVAVLLLDQRSLRVKRVSSQGLWEVDLPPGAIKEALEIDHPLEKLALQEPQDQIALAQAVHHKVIDAKVRYSELARF